MIDQKSVINLENVRQNPFCLDGVDIKTLSARPKLIVTNEPLQSLSPDISIQYIAAPALPEIFRKIFGGNSPVYSLFDWILNLISAFRLVRAMRQPETAALISLGKRSGSLYCFLSSFKMFQGGPVLAYRVLLPAKSGNLKTYLIKRSLCHAALIAVWSRTQIENYHRAFGIPREKFVFFPYKANHSMAEPKSLRVGDYIFSGGNSERDYKTLFEAVKGLSIPMIVSATKASVIRGLTIPENVILVAAEKIAFERLMAGSRFVALCVKENIIRGSAEATMLNAMWHGKPVVIADNNSASDYIEDGADGFIVPAGSAEQMRARILELWGDPQLIARIGEAARSKVNRLYTHEQYKTRIQTLAMLVFASPRR